MTALGELLIDFTENGISDQGNALLEANQVGLHVMCWQWRENWARKQHSSEGWGNDQFD